MWQLTSSSTCYSGARRVQAIPIEDVDVNNIDDNDVNDSSSTKVVARFAIEWHTASLEFRKEDDDLYDNGSRSPPRLSWRENTNRDDDPLVCVGYSAIADWECLALLDTSKLPVQEDDNNIINSNALMTQPAVGSATTATDASTVGRGGDFDDMSLSASTITTSVAAMSTDVAPHHRRGSTLSMENSASTFGIAGNFSSVASFDSTETPMASGTPDTRPPIALLILRNGTCEFATTLDFRPLAPTICQIPTATSPSLEGLSDERDFLKTQQATTGIWLGSPDHNKLYWFVPLGSSTVASLERIEPEHAAFHFESPITAIEFFTATATQRNHHCLVVACQDGTIRAIGLQYQLGEFCNVHFTQVIVDGPVVCLDVRVCTTSTTRQNDSGNENISGSSDSELWWHVTAGSLCGYVMEWWVDAKRLVQVDVDSGDGVDNESCQRGPFMVAEGFWNKTVQAEDSVLAVKVKDSNILVGTQSGRVLLYQKLELPALEDGSDKLKQQQNTYQLQWYAQLPYSIHGLCWIDDRFLVTTRRSLHVFRRHIRDDKTDPRRIAARIKSQLQQRIKAWEAVSYWAEEVPQTPDSKTDSEETRESPKQPNDSTANTMEEKVQAET